MKRGDYPSLIQEIPNTKTKSLDEYVEKVLETIRAENSHFVETLLKDNYFLIKDIDRPREND